MGDYPPILPQILWLVKSPLVYGTARTMAHRSAAGEAHGRQHAKAQGLDLCGPSVIASIVEDSRNLGESTASTLILPAAIWPASICRSSVLRGLDRANISSVRAGVLTEAWTWLALS